MFVVCAAAHFENCHRFGGPSDVVGFVDHAHNLKVINASLYSTDTGTKSE
jgi:hypothetical protein